MIERAYISNPDMNKINLAVQIKEEQISESQAANYPQVGLFTWRYQQNIQLL